MSELTWYWAYIPYLDMPDKQKESALGAGYDKVVFKYEADKVIAGKDEEIAELKQKLHDAEMRADLAEAAETERKIDYDNLKKEHRQTLRELWLARAERAKDKQAYYTHIRGDGWVHLVDKWINVERKCLKKAEEYK